MNFAYLKTIKELKSLYELLNDDAASEAASSKAESTEAAYLRCKRYASELETLVRFVYKKRFSKYNASAPLIKLIKEKGFKNLFGTTDAYNKLYFVYLAGNNAAFDNNIDDEAAYLALENLKETTYIIFSRLNSFTEAENEVFKYKPSQNYAFTEAQTRALYIDADLKAAGYTLQKQNGRIVPGSVCIEIEVHDLPNQKVGYVDYVIYNRQGLPVAVIEAKKTSENEERGAQQARDYADALVNNLKLSYRPIIYYTNGYTIKLQDRLGYPARTVSNFASLADLELLIKRQKPGNDDKRKPILNKAIDNTIINRSKLVEAVQELLEAMDHMRRKGLLVLPCGVGKTRTAVALSKILINNDWAQNILFLADRNNLVSNALNPFSKYIEGGVSDISAANPSKDITARVCVCTYNTMLNFLNKPKKEFSVGHFDLIIVDEAHRTLFNVYRAIFEYFDSLVIGLTATPSKALDRSTYEILDLQIDEPTFEVKFEEAVNLEYLVSYRAFDKTSAILKNGLKYKDLSPQDKAKYEAEFTDEYGDIPESLTGAEFRRHIFNNATIDSMFADLLANGLRVEGGTKIGKTLIFASDHEHAVKLAERFKLRYPHLGDDFCQVIDNQINKNKTRQDNFAKKDSNPQIVISVDMMDTGVDIPEILNLVFFKRVLSRIKFDQMWGRGTRTCEGLRPITPSRDYFEGRTLDDERREYMDKQGFFVFDYCDNFEFFDLRPEGKDPSVPLNLNQKLYAIRLDILTQLQSITYQEQPAYKAYYEKLKINFVSKLKALNTDRIDVKAKLVYVDKYSSESAFEYLSAKAVYEIKTQLLKLIDRDTVDDNFSKSFDLRVSIIQLSLLDDKIDSSRQQLQLMQIAAALLKKASISEIFVRRDILKAIADEAYYTSLDFFKLEQAKEEVGPLIKYLKGEPSGIKITDFNDRIETKTRDVRYDFDNFKTYREKIISYLNKHYDELESVKKIISLEKLTGRDLKELQMVLDSLKNPDTEEEGFESSKDLIVFIRRIVGLDKKAIDEKCADFLNANDFNKEQRQLIDLIIDFAIRNGNVTAEDILNEETFSDCNVTELFDNDDLTLRKLLQLFNDSLNVAA